MTIQKRSTSSSKQQRNKAPVAKKCRGKSKLKKQLKFSDVPESHAAECCEADLYHRRHEIWYTREEYSEFHKDRFETIKRFRASGGDVALLDADSQSVRGLEPFWTPQGHRELQGCRKLHKSTVMLEQARQNLTNTKDAERFRIMVAAQSDLAQKRAQDLATLDEVEANKVYNPAMPQNSSIPPNHPALSPLSLPETKDVENLSPRSTVAFVPQATTAALPSLSLLGSQQIRALQEHNARRLMEMYACNNGDTSQQAFRFPIRRDSLVGGARFIHAMMISQQNGA
eukprot:CAMPEP_0113650530 /NCGR_PEP_ID=MMETSP0017_2-20120614/26891_1 /TAXON_ID=2856 /ORGANISM="Cylindrotheca closterium" /LENGTH=284 /DNA_ID=CAMNT_0000563055 /DNA_START=88 /DNA_END=945 /DNA_ORIENTATION=+ /assembly_acc=CAM_ASM_000147